MWCLAGAGEREQGQGEPCGLRQREGRAGGEVLCTGEGEGRAEPDDQVQTPLNPLRLDIHHIMSYSHDPLYA